VRLPGGGEGYSTLSTPKSAPAGVKVETTLILMQDLPKLGLNLSSGTSHTISVHVFLKT